MIRLEHYSHKRFDLTRIEMDAGDTLFLPAADVDKSFGVVCLEGGTEHHSAQPPAVHLPQAGDGLLLNDRRTGWSNDDVGHHDLSLRAPSRTVWVCVADNGSGHVDLALREIDGQELVGAHTGIIALAGNLSVASRPLMPNDFYAPKPYLSTIVGRGSILELTSCL